MNITAKMYVRLWNGEAGKVLSVIGSKVNVLMANGVRKFVDASQVVEAESNEKFELAQKRLHSFNAKQSAAAAAEPDEWNLDKREAAVVDNRFGMRRSSAESFDATFASLTTVAAKNEDVINMFIQDSFPKDKMLTWGTDNLKISKNISSYDNIGWALINYLTPIMFRNTKGDLFFNTQKYSNTTTKIQGQIKRALEQAGVTASEVDEAGLDLAIDASIDSLPQTEAAKKTADMEKTASYEEWTKELDAAGESVPLTKAEFDSYVKNTGKVPSVADALSWKGVEAAKTAGQGRHETTKSPNDPTFSKEWSGVSGAPHAKGKHCPDCGEQLHKEGQSFYCPVCDDYKTPKEGYASKTAGHPQDLVNAEAKYHLGDILIPAENADEGDIGQAMHILDIKTEDKVYVVEKRPNVDDKDREKSETFGVRFEISISTLDKDKEWVKFAAKNVANLSQQAIKSPVKTQEDYGEMPSKASELAKGSLDVKSVKTENGVTVFMLTNGSISFDAEGKATTTVAGVTDAQIAEFGKMVKTFGVEKLASMVEIKRLQNKSAALETKAVNTEEGMGHHIKISYSQTTPESAEDGDFSDTGWKDEEGESMEPDESDKEEGLTAVDLAVKFLQNEGAFYTSSGSWHPGLWYSTPFETISYETGTEEEKSFHLYNFTEDEERQVFDRFHSQKKGAKKDDISQGTDATKDALQKNAGMGASTKVVVNRTRPVEVSSEVFKEDNGIKVVYHLKGKYDAEAEFFYPWSDSEAEDVRDLPDDEIEFRMAMLELEVAMESPSGASDDLMYAFATATGLDRHNISSVMPPKESSAKTAMVTDPSVIRLKKKAARLGQWDFDKHDPVWKLEAGDDGKKRLVRTTV